LTDVLMKVSDPNHEDYGKHWTREQIADLTADYAGMRKVVKYLEGRGARVTDRTMYEEFVDVEAVIAVWEKVLSTEFYEFEHEDWAGQKLVRALGYSVPAELDVHIGHLFEVSNFPATMSGKPVVGEVISEPTAVTTMDNANECDE